MAEKIASKMRLYLYQLSPSRISCTRLSQ